MEWDGVREWEGRRAECGLGVMWTPRVSLDIGESTTKRFDFMLHPGLTLFQQVGQLYASRCPLHPMCPNTTRVCLRFKRDV